MILTIDIGNSAIKFGVWSGETLVSKTSQPTSAMSDVASAADAVRAVSGFKIEKAIACSVVPAVNPTIAQCTSDILGAGLRMLTGESDLGIKVEYKTRKTLGADRLVAAYGAFKKYGAPCIVCDFGTATTIDLVKADGVFAGGMIAPGIGMLCESLASRTAQLIEIAPRVPDQIIGTDTKSSIESGVYAAAVGTLETALDFLADDIDEIHKVIATGGYASLIAEGTDSIDVVDENLVMEGLRFAAGEIGIGNSEFGMR